MSFRKRAGKQIAAAAAAESARAVAAVVTPPDTPSAAALSTPVLDLSILTGANPTKEEVEQIAQAFSDQHLVLVLNNDVTDTAVVQSDVAENDLTKAVVPVAAAAEVTAVLSTLSATALATEMAKREREVNRLRQQRQTVAGLRSNAGAKVAATEAARAAVKRNLDGIEQQLQDAKISKVSLDGRLVHVDKQLRDEDEKLQLATDAWYEFAIKQESLNQ